MRLLPSERSYQLEKVCSTFEKDGELVICEPCNCGSYIRHNNGGNCHEIVHLKRDSGKVYVKIDSTSELNPEAEWEECDDWMQVVSDRSDWL